MSLELPPSPQRPRRDAPLIGLALGLALLPLTGCPDDEDASPTQAPEGEPDSYAIVDSGQSLCYDERGDTGCPSSGADLYGQDAQHAGRAPDYTVSGDGTVTDEVTGLVWQEGFGSDVAYEDAEGYCEDLELGGRTDWHLPSIKELYSLMNFAGSTGTSDDYYALPDNAVPYLDTEAFDFEYPSGDSGLRYIDAQYATTTLYVSRVFADNGGQEEGQSCFFGVNFADGRIKCYPSEGTSRGWYARCVAGEGYGLNAFTDGGDGTVTDAATGLMWLQDDSGGLGAGALGDGTMDWGDALAFCEDLSFAGHDDWRLPNAKELQSLLDYSRSRDTTGSAAIDPVFNATEIVDEAGDFNFGYYWTSTTHLDGMVLGTDAVYMAFGEALGYTTPPGSSQSLFLDVHGAGAQRGDPKTGSRDDFPVWGGGPQGDVRRVFNLARCVRDEG